MQLKYLRTRTNNNKQLTGRLLSTYKQTYCYYYCTTSILVILVNYSATAGGGMKKW